MQVRDESDLLKSALAHEVRQGGYQLDAVLAKLGPHPELPGSPWMAVLTLFVAELQFLNTNQY